MSRGPRGAPDERRHEAATVGGVTVEIVRRIDFLCSSHPRLADQTVIDGSAVQQRLRPGQPMRARAGADHADMRIAQRPLPALVIKQENAGESEIALAPGIFSEGPAPPAWPFRQVQFGDDLV